MLALSFNQTNMGKTKISEYFPVIVPVSLFVYSVAFATYLLSENCFFFESQPGPYSCHTIPNDCCEFGPNYSLSHAVLFCGIGLTIGTMIYFLEMMHPANLMSEQNCSINFPNKIYKMS